MFVYIQIHVRCDVLVEKDAFPQCNSKSNFPSSPNKLLFKLAPYLLHATATAYTPPQIQPCIYTTLHAFKSTNTHQCVYRCFVSWSGAPNFKAPKALFIGAEPRIFKVPPEAPLKISSEVRRRRGEREIFRGASGGTSNNSGRSPAPAGGARKSKKSPTLVPSLRQP